jgi:hypothetical protein
MSKTTEKKASTEKSETQGAKFESVRDTSAGALASDSGSASQNAANLLAALVVTSTQ